MLTNPAPPTVVLNAPSSAGLSSSRLPLRSHPVVTVAVQGTNA